MSTPTLPQVLLELVFKCYEQRRALLLRSGTGTLEVPPPSLS